MLENHARFLPRDRNSQTRALVLKAVQLRNKPDEFIQLFHDDAVIYVIGTPFSRPFAGSHRGHAEILRLRRDVDGETQMLGQQIRHVVIDGDRFALHRLVTIRHHGTARILKLHIAHLAQLREGRIAEVIEFCDTVSITRLFGDGPEI